MTTNNDFQDLEELRKGYNLVNEKYSESDKTCPEFRIKDVKGKLTGTRGWYLYRLVMTALGMIAAPLIFYQFHRLGLYQPHFTYYLVFFLVLCITSLIADLYARSVLAMDQLPYMSLKEAAEHVIHHKKVRHWLTLINLPFYVIFIAWTLYIASGGTWDFSHMILSLVLMAVCFVLGLFKIKKNREDLESIYKGLED